MRYLMIFYHCSLYLIEKMSFFIWNLFLETFTSVKISVIRYFFLIVSLSWMQSHTVFLINKLSLKLYFWFTLISLWNIIFKMKKKPIADEYVLKKIT